MGEFDHDVRSPRLAGDYGSIESERADQQLEVVSNGFHVEPVIGFVASPMAALVDGHNGVAERSKVPRDSVPETCVGSEAMYENERDLAVGATRFPCEAVEGEVPAHGDHFTARRVHIGSFARQRMNGTMEAR